MWVLFEYFGGTAGGQILGGIPPDSGDEIEARTTKEQNCRVMPGTQREGPNEENWPFGRGENETAEKAELPADAGNTTRRPK